METNKQTNERPRWTDLQGLRRDPTAFGLGRARKRQQLRAREDRVIRGDLRLSAVGGSGQIDDHRPTIVGKGGGGQGGAGRGDEVGLYRYRHAGPEELPRRGDGGQEVAPEIPGHDEAHGQPLRGDGSEDEVVGQGDGLRDHVFGLTGRVVFARRLLVERGQREVHIHQRRWQRVQSESVEHRGCGRTETGGELWYGELDRCEIDTLATRGECGRLGGQHSGQGHGVAIEALRVAVDTVAGGGKQSSDRQRLQR